MWNFVLFSTFFLMISLAYHFHFGYPDSIVENPKTEYDYVIGELTFYNMNARVFQNPSQIFYRVDPSLKKGI